MDFLELAKERYSVRKFDGRPLSDEETDKIIEAGLLAPTAANKCPQKIFVIKSEEGLDALEECTKYTFGSKTVFIVCADRNLAWKRSFDGQDSVFVDASIVATQMMYEAWSLGIGSTWVMFFNPEKIKEMLSLDESVVPVAILPMGYAAEDCKPAPMHYIRKNKSEIVTEK